MVTQKLFDSEMPQGRHAEIPRRQINLVYDDIELADPGSAGKDKGWHSYSDLSEDESSNQGFSDCSEGYGELVENHDPFSLLVGDDFPVSKRLKNPRVNVEKDRYAVPDKDWDPFESFTSKQEPPEEFYTDE